MTPYGILISLALLALTNGEDFKLCLGPPRTQCIGVQEADLYLRNSDDPSTNWRFVESTGSGGIYLQNLVSCKVVIMENDAAKMKTQSADTSQGWLMEEVAAPQWWKKSHFRMYNQAYTNREEKHVLDASSNNFRMSPLVVGKTSQKFFKVETSNESSPCPAPENTDLEAQSILRIRLGPCRRGRAFTNGRCQIVHRPRNIE
eukprot:TRINITY_DN15762_c0_g1_i1.p1 TRINITY_DN15762_c0_g1~~TRINITY_DN15762_c0_g1_i1.p1  ORF type:complete len:229 (-),score=55.76 TRINITY_DN15762_c0_g1_i1:29-634(-)